MYLYATFELIFLLEKWNYLEINASAVLEASLVAIYIGFGALILPKNVRKWSIMNQKVTS
jgi:hypothetical protein